MDSPTGGAARLLEAMDLIDLHIHVGAAVAPHILWEIAHDHGFKLPVKSYPEFQDLVYHDKGSVADLAKAARPKLEAVLR